ncbi:bifunctional phosphopantothenoylcysteine decarboxylase/phosphopantothenate synthase [Sphingomonas sp.]|uniref:bifunctional phosphopantothenoylcysteine decarboxylase/phosphopantothenate synthase n=1 Tax=Sphingomonas sp. TaxID=28214 RepID=UPI002D7F7AAC|nr:bifunctional phosphopantothenoylcysteine decarboxylase/phosphopantothenate synthase [Sphingomonas sp.]HEU0044557.1 bifunctional phosphopantothenoylcysteine decarboxylase/phosphopantothenate synthase [Sphingomonas sp.]
MKRILLIVGGGIAAYKACELIRLLRKAGHAVRCVLTEGGSHFVTPMTLAALSEDQVYTSLWDLKDEAEMGHIQLSREADLLVVAPATADLIASMAAGRAHDLATTVLLATDKPVLVTPAMNVRMWEHPATQRNVAQLRADGLTVLEPEEGAMACGEYGPGRLPEPAAIAAAIQDALLPSRSRGGTADLPSRLREGSGEGLSHLSTIPPASGRGALAGKHVLVTAGPTHEPIDPVRYIANRSSGRQGFAIAAAAAQAGARVTLVAGPVALPTPAGVARVDVETAVDMSAAVDAALPADVAIMVAAVADWRVEAAGQKVKKGEGLPALTLVENPDILATLARSPQRPALLIGFAAETEQVVEHAVTKRARKGCDWLVANDVSTDVFGSDGNSVHLVTAGGIESWDRLPKVEVARRLIERIANA